MTRQFQVSLPSLESRHRHHYARAMVSAAQALLSSALALEEAQQPKDALAEAWQALDLAPEDRRAKSLVARLLRTSPDLASPERTADVERLLRDPEVDPDSIATAGWTLVHQRMIEQGGEPATIAQSLESDSLALLLLAEACVFLLDAERALSAVRRWLLISGQWRQYPRLAQALIAQAARNGGAWPLDSSEADLLEQSGGLPFAAAYFPPRPALPARATFADPVTQKVSDQYVRFPFPVWSRLPVPEPTTLSRHVEKLDPGRPCRLPVRAELLVAGCGTGWEAAWLARRFPDAHVTAIDISASSLGYAIERCAGLDIDFHLLDLHEVGRLGRRFDLITCTGVLHHLADPEAGWAKLAQVLAPAGVMRVMVYSRIARLWVEAAKTHIADFRGRPVDDDLLRLVRQRLIEKAPQYVAGFPDFYSLSGVHDFLVHSHEDCFDVPRIAAALDRLGLELISFELPTTADKARYGREHPGDPLFRDSGAWNALEKARPFTFLGMYKFWCRAPTANDGQTLQSWIDN